MQHSRLNYPKSIYRSLPYFLVYSFLNEERLFQRWRIDTFVTTMIERFYKQHSLPRYYSIDGSRRIIHLPCTVYVQYIEWLVFQKTISTAIISFYSAKRKFVILIVARWSVCQSLKYTGTSRMRDNFSNVTSVATSLSGEKRNYLNEIWVERGEGLIELNDTKEFSLFLWTQDSGMFQRRHAIVTSSFNHPLE